MKRVLLVAVFLLWAQALQAATYYVAAGGDNGGPGTIGSPFATIQHAANVAVCGDTINIRGGTYTENVGIGTYPSLSINTVDCASFSNTVTVQGYNGEMPIIQTPLGEAIFGFQSGDYPAATRSIYWIIKDLILDGGIHPDIESSAIIGEGIAHVRLDGVEIRHTQGSGVFLNTFTSTGNHATDYDIDGWEFLNINCHDTGEQHQADGFQHHCLYLAHTINTLVDGGTFYHNYGYCAQIYGDHTTIRNTQCYDSNYANGGNGGYVVSADGDNKLYNNRLWDIQYGDAIQLGQPCVGCYALNNTVFSSSTGIAAEVGSSGGFIENNISFSNSINIVDRGVNTTISNNITTDPTFASTTFGSSDYLKLQATSNAINAGANLTGLGITALLTDAAGTNRPTTGPPYTTPWDSGAFQASGSSPTAMLVSVSPTSGVQGTAPTVTMVGSLTAFDGTSTVSISGSGVTASACSATDITHLACTFTVTGGAAAGARNVTVSTIGQPDVVKNGGFTVTAAAVPAITSVSPSQCVQGQTSVSVAVVGINTNFVNGTTVLTAMAGITTNSVTVSNSTHVTLVLTCSGGASAGSRNIILTTSGETPTGGTNAFNVIQASSCAPPNLTDASGIVAGQCTASTPDDGSGTVTEVTPNLPSNVSTLTGAYLVAVHVVAVKPGSFGDTTNTPLTSVIDDLANTYAKCASNPTNLTAQIEIWVAPSTHAGKPKVTFAHGGSTIFFSYGFLFETYGLLSSNPCDATGYAAGSSTTPTIVSGVTAAAGEIVVAVVTSGASLVTENSPYTLIQAVTSNALEYKLSGASGAAQTATFTTSNTAWIGAMLTLKPNSPNATVASCVPNYGYAGSTAFSLTCVGSGTHWDGTTVPSFSNMGGIANVSINVTTATAAVFTFDITPGALVGTRDVIFTTGTEVASLPNGFFVNNKGASRGRLR